MYACRRWAFLAFALLSSILLPHALGAADRITAAIDNARRITLSGHVSRRIASAVDQGLVASSTELPYVTMVLRPSASQQADLTQLLAAQQDPSSSSYHRWLSPEQYADRFGVSQNDLSKITAWLGQFGLTVKYAARARNAVVFGGSASQVASAFGVEIHQYLVNGEQHYANANGPSIPAALDGLVLAIRGLDDFRLKPRLVRYAKPRETTSGGSHQLAPGDVATIYDINPLYSAGITGTGLKIAVAGQTDIILSDIESFRTMFGLPTNNPTVTLIPGSKDPGILESSGDLSEADLDLELSGAVARNATIIFVNSTDVINSLQYAIDQNLAPIVSTSYGDCELDEGAAASQALEQVAEQANAQGQTIFAASGDDGAADCFGIGDGPTIDNALAVDEPASLPEVTGVGGTEFNEGSGSYWNTQNSSSLTSALSYIPETSWNDSSIDGSPAASGGGASAYFSKPSWQSAAGVPDDGKRDVPDISLSASADHDGYVIVSGGQTQLIGGTSVGPPQFAGIAALLSQYLVANGYASGAGLGNINPQLYALAPSTGVFHDITSGNNIVVPCSTRNCTGTAIGYDAGAGYDQVTGIGSVDVYNLVTAWHSTGSASKGSTTLTLAASATSLVFGGSTVLTAAVATSNGGTPTGTVTFTTGTFTLGTATLSGSGAAVAATLDLAGVQLAVGSNSITAQYNGDSNYYGSTGTTTVTITSTATGPPTVGGLTNAASFAQSYAPGAIVSIFGANLAPATTSTPGLPLPTMLAGTWVTINGIAAPLYYVSPTQLNIQIPYEVTANSVDTLRVNNNGESVFYSFKVAATAPGIFTFDNGAPVPFSTAKQGQEITLYMTGAGAVSPTVATGSAPAADTPVSELPAPAAAVSLTVGGVAATIDFIGIPTWSVGVVQINYTIPPNAPLGSQAVILSVGGVPSASTQLTVTQ
ncbi:MAG TPA: protease pro-enzyme activation domain-containing protein [Bryobacteraceae bacterium]|nr:protease pro-enzyme activation domain-containing protein [Bryobacteraceae bacterium]